MVKNILKFMAMEAKKKSSFSSIDMKLLVNGFFSQKKLLYQFSDYPLEFYVNDWETEFRLKNINNFLAKNVLSNKLLFKLFLEKQGAGDSLPETIGLLTNGRFCPFAPWPSLNKVLEKYGRIIAKPVSGHGGNGVFFLAKEQDAPVSGDFVLEKEVFNHKYSMDIYEKSLNTIRVFTLRDPSDGLFFIAGAVHRFGTEKTGCVDNFSKGGLTASVDFDSGVLSAARSNPGVYEIDFHSVHIDTLAQIEGVQVPFWDKVKDISIEMSQKIPGLNLVGWDIAVSDCGLIVVEGNGTCPNPNILQTHSPLLTDERVLKFFSYYNVISDKKKIKIKNSLASKNINGRY